MIIFRRAASCAVCGTHDNCTTRQETTTTICAGKPIVLQNIDHLVILVRGAVSADGSSDTQTRSMPAHGCVGAKRGATFNRWYDMSSCTGDEVIRIALEGYAKCCSTGNLFAALDSPTNHKRNMPSL